MAVSSRSSPLVCDRRIGLPRYGVAAPDITGVGQQPVLLYFRARAQSDCRRLGGGTPSAFAMASTVSSGGDQLPRPSMEM